MSLPMRSLKLLRRYVMVQFKQRPVCVSARERRLTPLQGGVDYLFTVLGSDHPSIIEAYVRRQNVLKREFPRMILFQHEVSCPVA